MQFNVLLTEVFVLLVPPLNSRPQIIGAVHHQLDHGSLLLDALPDQGGLLLTSRLEVRSAPGLDCLFQFCVVNAEEKALLWFIPHIRILGR